MSTPSRPRFTGSPGCGLVKSLSKSPILLSKIRKDKNRGDTQARDFSELKFLFNLRPLFPQNTITNRISPETIAHQHVAAQNAFEFSTDFFNGCSRNAVTLIRAQFQTLKLQRFENVRHHQKFTLPVQARSLKFPPDPRPADFDPLVFVDNISKTAATGKNFGLLVENGECITNTILPVEKRVLHVLFQ